MAIILTIMLVTIIVMIFLTRKEQYISSIWCSIVSGCFLLFSVILHGTHESPTALDVYQNKTTLEITYKDGVPVDSVVVFKKSKREN